MKPSKKTITILNRFITSIPNWWVRIAPLLSIIIFLISCEEELSELGFRNLKRFKVVYAEIPLETSVLWIDSLRSKNLNLRGETQRLLIGSYNDPAFGNISSEAFMQIRPTVVSSSTSFIGEYDSIALKLKVDFYSYGSPGKTNQKFALHEVTEEMFPAENYYTNSTISVSDQPIGIGELMVDQDFFKSELDDTNKDSVITLKIKVSDQFGQRLFDAVDYEDENYTNFELFRSIFKGLAVRPSGTDKIIGINYSDLSNSSLIIYYHDASGKKTLLYSLSSGVTFSKISSDRTNSDLSTLNQFHQEIDPGLKRYSQSGSSIVTKIDFSKFYDYTDTIPNIVINSAEIVIENPESSSNFYFPTNLNLILLSESNRLKTFKTKQDTIDYLTLSGVIALDQDSKFCLAQDQRDMLTLTYNSKDNRYASYPTLFFQRLYDLKDPRFSKMAIRPYEPQPGKSVNRLVFPKDQIKLKLYYTRANIDAN